MVKRPTVSQKMQGNRNAYKDDEEEVKAKLNEVISGLFSKKYRSLAEALLKNDLSYQALSNYRKKYAQNETVLELLKSVKCIGAMILEIGGLERTINHRLAIFLLKHHYGYSDKPKPVTENIVIALHVAKSDT